MLVLLATHNGSEWLPAQIDSLRCQQRVTVHALMHDDESTDGSRALLHQLAPDWTLLPACPRLGSAAQNFLHLFRHAELDGYDYVALCDQDDVWYCNKLCRAVQALCNTQAQGYSSNVVAFWPDRSDQLVHKAQPLRRWDYLFEAAGPGCTYVVPVGVAQSFQTWLLQHEEATRSIRFHDWLLYAWVRSSGGDWFIDPEPSMRYRQHRQNEVGVNLGWRPAWRRALRVFSGFAFDQVRHIGRCLGDAEQQWLQRGLDDGWKGWGRLALHARQCRRSPLDQVWFAVAVVLYGLACSVTSRRRRTVRPGASG